MGLIDGGQISQPISDCIVTDYLKVFQLKFFLGSTIQNTIPGQNFSLQYRYKIKHRSDEIEENYQLRAH